MLTRRDPRTTPPPLLYMRLSYVRVKLYEAQWLLAKVKKKISCLPVLWNRKMSLSLSLSLSLTLFFRLAWKVCSFVNSSKHLGYSYLYALNPLTTKNYNFLTYVQASFSWLIFILKIQFKIRNQRPRKPPSSALYKNWRVSKISCPSYWIRHFEKWKSDVKFIISDFKSTRVQSSTKIVGFQKYYVRHIGSAILNSEIPMSNS